MRCLYCGKELALLKRLTGGGDFCSDAHKQSYQEEYNRLALSRLLQAQKKRQQTGNTSGHNPAAPPPSPVAVEERVAEEPPAEAPALETSTANAAALEVSQVQETVEVSTEAATPENAPETEPEALETAGFMVENISLAAVPDATPQLESWLELSGGPVVTELRPQNDVPGLDSAALVPLELRPEASAMAAAVLSTELSPQAFAEVRPDPRLPRKVPTRHQLPAGMLVTMDVAASPVDGVPDRALTGGVEFQSVSVEFDNSPLLELSPTAIDFPAEDSDVVVLVRSVYNGPVLDLAPNVGEPAAAVEDDSPRASLEALSRLHQDLIQEEQTRQAAGETPAAEPVEVRTVDAVALEPVEVASAPTLSVAPQAIEIASVAVLDAVAEPVLEPQKAAYSTDLFEIAIKTFPPPKPTPAGGDVLASQTGPLLPNLKSLPLRPKVALATGYAPPSRNTARSSAPSAVPPRAQEPARATPGAKHPTTRLAQPKQPAPAARAAASKTLAAKSEPGKSEAMKSEQAKPETVKAPSLEAASAKLQPATATKSAVGETAPKSSASGAAQKAPAEKGQPAVKQTAGQPKAVTEQPAKESSGWRKEQPLQDAVPSFGTVQLSKPTFAGSLKLKLGIGIAIIVVACTTYFGWGGSSHKPAGSNAAISADGAGPSIIMGEGGWVEGWGGDPTGIHAGRQITIYRPSLKLSDYRIEFQGSIDTKSLGWVFRAANPENYYAMKITMVSSGLSPKVALFKYIVVNGRQTQVGRVPIDLGARPDTVYKVRIDVRGPKFTTYMQGQQVDSWTDDQLKAGGVGFLNEREERGKVKSVSIRYLNGTAK
jgi:hypothetical protein